MTHHSSPHTPFRLPCFGRLAINTARLLIATTLTATATCSVASAQEVPKSFKIFNSIHYKGTPDLSRYGLLPLNLIYENRLAAANPDFPKQYTYSAASIDTEARAAEAKPGQIVSLDLESWGRGPGAIEKYAMAAREFKRVSPASKVGMYGYVPLANNLLYRAIHEHSPSLEKAWIRVQSQVSPVAQAVDIFMPSLYTYGPDSSAWTKMAQMAIANARKQNPNKPVYAYIWPQFYSSKDPQLSKFIPAKLWRTELETLYPIADGVIVWTTSRGSIEFSTSMPWFQETLAFMKAHHLN